MSPETTVPEHETSDLAVESDNGDLTLEHDTSDLTLKHDTSDLAPELDDINSTAGPAGTRGPDHMAAGARR